MRLMAASALFVRGVLLMIIRSYQLFLSPVFTYVFGVECSFKQESCSRYAERVIRSDGIVVGICKIGKRILRCSVLGASE